MTCFTPIFGKRIRVTRLDKCGNVPAIGEENAFIATDGFISVRLSSEIEDATEILTKKADGSLCVNTRTDPSFKYFTLEVDFCGVDTELLAFMTNAEVYETAVATDASGIVVPEGTIEKRFALELWTGLTGAACDPGVQEASGYMLLPFVSAGVLADVEVNGENAVNFSMSSATTRGGNAWGVGPYNILGTQAAPTKLPQPVDVNDHLLLIQSNTAPPAHLCGAQTMSAAGGVTPPPAPPAPAG